jgi:hypothetical protein
MGEDKVASHAKVKFGHCEFQNRPLGVKTGQHPARRVEPGAHDAICQTAEMNRQVAVAAAGNSQAAITAAEVMFYKTVWDSARTNGLLEVGHFNSVIRQIP